MSKWVIAGAAMGFGLFATAQILTEAQHIQVVRFCMDVVFSALQAGFSITGSILMFKVFEKCYADAREYVVDTEMFGATLV